MHYLPKTPKRCRRSACIFPYSCFHPFRPFWVFGIFRGPEMVHNWSFLGPILSILGSFVGRPSDRDLGSEISDLRSGFWSYDLKIGLRSGDLKSGISVISCLRGGNDLNIAILALLGKTAIMHYLPKTPKRCRRSACIFMFSCFHPFGPFWVFWILRVTELIHFQPF